MFSVKRVTGFKIIMAVALMVFACTFVSAAEIEDDFRIAAENREMVLYINEVTTEIAVERKDSGDIWYSNPPDRESAETIATGRRADRLAAQLRISYYTPRNNRNYMNSYTDCVVHDQFTIEFIDNGVRVDYRLGEEWSDEEYPPVIISQSDLEKEVLSHLDEQQRQFVLDLYYPLELVEKPDDYERESVHGVDKEEVFGNYVLSEALELEGRFKRNFLQNLFSRIEENRSDYDSFGDVRSEDIEQFKEEPAYILKDRLRAWDVDDYVQLLREIDYDPQQNIVFHQQNNIEPPQRNIRLFDIPVIYTLNERGLQVKIPMEEVNYPRDVIDPSMDGQESTYPLHNISVLEFFGAAGPDEEGYIFVPDGSGALIELNHDRAHYVQSYSQQLYGLDYAERERENLRITSQLHQLPVYGLKDSEKGWLAVIESGDPVGRIQADVAGRLFSYNHVLADFKVMPNAELRLSGEDYEHEFIYVHQARLIEDDIQVQFFLLEEEKSDYVGMAHTYQDYLVEKHDLQRLQPVKELPFYLDIVGSIHQVLPFFGIPRRTTVPMTTYQESIYMLEELSGRGIENVIVNYNGWLKGGREHNYPGRMRLESQVGREQDRQELLTFLKEKDYRFYPEAAFMYVYNTRPFDGYSVRGDSSRFLNRGVVAIPDYDEATYLEEPGTEKYLVSPAKFEQVMADFMADFTEKDFEGIALRYPGNHLSGDYRTNPDRLIDRTQAAAAVDRELKSIKQQAGLNILLRGANAYILPYADDILNVPLFASGHNNTDYSVPFLPIVLNGYYNFAGDPLNLTVLEEAFLKTVETGALPYYRGMYAPSSKMKRTTFDDNFLLHYGDWLDEAADRYERMNDLSTDLYHQRIEDHKRLEKGVFMTVYEKGERVLVNYNDHPVMVEGINIAARDFELVKEGAGHE